MSAGSRIVHVRIPRELLDSIESALTTQKDYKQFIPLDLGPWIRHACQTKLDNITRKRKKRKHDRLARKLGGVDREGLLPLSDAEVQSAALPAH